MLDDLVGILDKAPRDALMTRLAALLAPGWLARRALGRLAAVAGRRQRRVARVLPGPTLQRLNALAQIADLVKQHQRLMLGGVPASPRDPPGILTPKLHAP
jgi:hypothetical protein